VRFALVLAALSGVIAAQAGEPIPDTSFVQEFHQAYPIAASGSSNDVRAIAVDPDDGVWAATRAGLFRLEKGAWRQVSGATTGPHYKLYVDTAGVLWVGAWDGAYRVKGERAVKQARVDGTITAFAETTEGLIALGPEGTWRHSGHDWTPLENNWSRHIRDATVTRTGDLYIGTGVGLYRQRGDRLDHFYLERDLYSGDIRSLARDAADNVWIGALGGIDVYSQGVYREHYGPEEGLPNADVRRLAFDERGTLWAGTALGIARLHEGTWSLRHSKRWLLSDDVRDISFDSKGTAWVATRAGVSAIRRRQMTLEEKAAYYLDICHKRHIRPPYIVEKCWLPNPNDFSVWEPRDDDNDGTWTALYMAMESLRWAVTKDPEAREHALRAYETLEFFEKVTPIQGLFARTVIPSTATEMSDANHVMTPEEYAERRVRDPRTKRVDERWRLSEDGQWRWKGDTSSDEMVGHMFGYYFFYELAATEEDRERIRTHLRKIVDYIIDGGYTIRDLDGKATRWGVWAPETVKGDPDWRVEGVNKTFEVLSYLKATYHMTGDDKYQREYDKLITEHGYAEMARRPKSYGRSERTHIQDNLIAMSTPALLMYEQDPTLHANFMEGITWAYQTIEHDQNPFFNFVYGMAGGTGFHLEESVAFMRDQPLDLRHWTIDNSKREDITFGRHPKLRPLQTSRMLPPSERGVMRWDKNPWAVVSGDFNDPAGHLESSGVFWLLPYWMGRYYGFIGAPE
jgi:hypothetical protein